MSYRSIDPADVPDMHPVAHVRDAWPALAEGRSVASWERFDPLDFPRVLPWVLLLRPDDPGDPDHLRYVICGDGCRQTFGFSFQGKRFGDGLTPLAAAQRRAEFADIRQGLGPLYSFAPVPVSNREFIMVYRGVFGFGADAAGVDRYMIVLAPEYVRVRGRRAPSGEPCRPGSGLTARTVDAD